MCLLDIDKVPKWLRWVVRGLGYLQCAFCPHRKDCAYRRITMKNDSK